MKTTAVDRRQFLALSTLAALGAAAVPRAFGQAAKSQAPAPPVPQLRWAGYGKALVIDGLGGPGGGEEKSADGLLTAAELADVRASGLTAANLTISSVG